MKDAVVAAGAIIAFLTRCRFAFHWAARYFFFYRFLLPHQLPCLLLIVCNSSIVRKVVVTDRLASVAFRLVDPRYIRFGLSCCQWCCRLLTLLAPLAANSTQCGGAAVIRAVLLLLVRRRHTCLQQQQQFDLCEAQGQ